MFELPSSNVPASGCPDTNDCRATMRGYGKCNAADDGAHS